MKKVLTAAAVAIASLAQTNDVNANVQTQQKQIVQDKQGNKKEVAQTREIKVDPLTGGLYSGFYDRGRSPKEYGQWLQSTGRQKWNKKK